MHTLRTALALLTLLALPLSAEAQSTEAELELVDPARRAEAAAELASIDHQSDLATAGYVTSTIVHVAGVGMMAVGSIAGFCISFTSSCPDRTGWDVLTGLGAGFAVVGLAGIFVSIGVDVGSGRRRNEWREELGVEDLALSIAPSDDGAVLLVSGAF